VREINTRSKGAGVNFLIICCLYLLVVGISAALTAFLMGDW
jgi:hypothetical protein